jgi:iron complex outermembrane receptor protein
VWLNAAIPAGNGEFYAFGGWSNREGNSSGFFRSAGDGRTVPALYPNGFLPTILTEPTDTSLVIGYHGLISDDWSYDAAVNYGSSEFKFREENTVNVSYWFEPLDPDDPTGPRFEESAVAADTGTLENEMLSLTLDLTGIVDWEIGAGPLFVAAGAEWREEGYKIEPGDEISYEYGRTDDRSIQIFDQNGDIAQPGAQGFPGWSPREAVDDDRDSIALYVDFESQLSERFLAGLAVRYEDFSDFGSTINGKFSGRFDLTDRLSVRGTVSTGFRAPGVQQAFYSQRSTNLNAEGVLTDTLTARQGGLVTQAFGIPPLEEETSLNYSVGIVGRPADNFRYTVDYYRIDIDDRIIFSSNIQPESGPCLVPDLCPIRTILEGLGVGQVLFFTNAIDTKTEGLDIVASHDVRLANNSLLSLEGAFHFNDTDVTKIRSSSAILPPDVLFDNAQVTLIEEGQPGEHFVLSGTYFQNRWSTNLRFNFFGEVAGEGFTPGFKQTWDGAWLVDLAFTYDIRDDLSFTVGGLNIFDEFPDKWDPVNAFPFPQLGFVYGWETLPFGINGGYYFARFNYRFNHKS